MGHPPLCMGRHGSQNMYVMDTSLHTLYISKVRTLGQTTVSMILQWLAQLSTSTSSTRPPQSSTSTASLTYYHPLPAPSSLFYISRRLHLSMFRGIFFLKGLAIKYIYIWLQPPQKVSTPLRLYLCLRPSTALLSTSIAALPFYIYILIRASTARPSVALLPTSSAARHWPFIVETSAWLHFTHQTETPPYFYIYISWTFTSAELTIQWTPRSYFFFVHTKILSGLHSFYNVSTQNISWTFLWLLQLRKQAFFRQIKHSVNFSATNPHTFLTYFLYFVNIFVNIHMTLFLTAKKNRTAFVVSIYVTLLLL